MSASRELGKHWSERVFECPEWTQMASNAHENNHYIIYFVQYMTPDGKSDSSSKEYRTIWEEK